MARGLAGAALFAVPVAVAALIGFGTGFSGVTGGLSSFTNGPDAVPAAAPTGPQKLNRAVVALASKQTGSGGATTTGGGGPSDVESTGSGTDSGSGSDGGSGGSGGGSATTQVPTVGTPSPPQVSLPGSGSGGAVGGATDSLNGTVNNVLGGVDKTVNGLLGR